MQVLFYLQAIIAGLGGNTYKQFYANQLTLNINLMSCDSSTTLDESSLISSYTIYRDSSPPLLTFQVLGLDTANDAGCAKTFEPDPVTAISEFTCVNPWDCDTIRVDATLAKTYSFNLKVNIRGAYLHSSTN